MKLKKRLKSIARYVLLIMAFIVGACLSGLIIACLIDKKLEYVLYVLGVIMLFYGIPSLLSWNNFSNVYGACGKLPPTQKKFFKYDSFLLYRPVGICMIISGVCITLVGTVV